MVAVNSVHVDPIKKKDDQHQVQTQAQNKVHGLTFGGDGDKGKAQNSAVFKSLDEGAQSAIKQAIGHEAWVDPKKIASALQHDGYDAKVGKENGKDYIEVTDKNGEKFRIWDIGSDGGIGTQDIDFNGALGDFKEEVHGLGNDVQANKVEAKSETKSLTETEKTKVDKSDETNRMKEYLKNYLISIGYQDPAEIERKVEELLPYYITK